MLESQAPVINFNPHSRVGSDLAVKNHARSRKISIHTPAWGATSAYSGNLISISYFNPHSRVGSNLYDCDSRVRAILFQSTLPRGERQIEYGMYPDLHKISIHTPAWGATAEARIPDPYVYNISIHTPAWGATATSEVSVIDIGFQSTLPRGERRGRTCTDKYSLLFQSTLPRGERHICRYKRGRIKHFNPHSRVGSDVYNCFLVMNNLYFNPHSRVGSDCKIAQKQF